MFVIDSPTVALLTVNGEARQVTLRPSDILLDILREQLGLTGAKPGCLNGDCGTCTVMMDGWPIKACLTLAAECIGHEIQTVEGLHSTPIQRAFVQHQAFQCGYCTSGFLMAAYALCTQHPDADEYLAEAWLQSNYCRCTGYQEIRAALDQALKETREGLPEGSAETLSPKGKDTIIQKQGG